MQALRNEEKIEYTLSYLPRSVSDEIRRISASRRRGAGDIREIRIRKEARCSAVFSDESVSLAARVGSGEIEQIVKRLCDGALYAKRESIASGYLSLDYGIRVGVVGSARYEHSSLVGISSFSSLVFRIPGGECEFSDELYRIFSEGTRRGMLIYSPPGVGKTTALRSLARSLGGGARPMRIAVVDERCEFYPGDYASCEVDILSGYKKSSGLEIATRTMSPEVLIIDEIGSEDVAAISLAVRCGIPIVATVHAGSFSELKMRPSLEPLFRCEAFDVFVGIRKEGREYRLEENRI